MASSPHPPRPGRSTPRRIAPALAAALALTASPGCTSGSAQRRNPAPCEGGPVDPAALRADVEHLAMAFLPRDAAHPENLDRAAGWLAARLREAGAADVREQVYEAGGRTYRNVLANVGPDTPERIVVGAHYDAAGDQPGADDDASGAAGVFALARLLAADPPPLRVELALWTLEEPPHFARPTMGSAVHAATLAAAGAKVRLAIAVEMIGYFSDAKGSQRYPALLGALYPDTGNFVAVVGRWGQGEAVRAVARGLRAGSDLPVETLSAPRSVTGVDFSDHRSFWPHGWDAVMVTDTSFYRNPNYHTPGDVPDTLDYNRMAGVVKGLACAVREVAGAAGPAVE